MTDDKPPNQYRMSAKGLEPLTPEHDRELHAKRSKLGLQDRKKVAILIVVLVVGCGIVAFQFLRGKGPSLAKAESAGASPALSLASESEIERVLKQLETNADQKDDLSILRVEQLVKEFDGYVRQRQVPLEHLRVNPFLMCVPQGERQQQQEEEAKRAAEEAKRKQQIRETAAQLTLSSVLVADEQRLALISGRVCRVGDVIAGFRVQEIEPDHVVLVCEDEEVTLRLFQKTR